MELTLANINVSSLLVLQLKSLLKDYEYFFSILQTLPNPFSTRSSKTNTSETAHLEETFEDEPRIHISEINTMMDRIGAQDLVGLFDEEEPSLEEIKESFEVFDVNKDGFIDCSELQTVLCSLGWKEGCSLEECRRMIMAFDANGDGLIDFQEFLKFMEICLC